METSSSEAFRLTCEYMNRKYQWKGRAYLYLMKSLCNQCLTQKICQRQTRNSLIQWEFWKTGRCPDMKPIWKKVLG